MSDVELNDEGRHQAVRLAQALRHLRVSAVYSSDLKRALDTADAVASEHALDVVIEPALREMNQGEFEGVPYVEIRRSHGELLKRWRKNPESVIIPGGECLLDVQERVFAAIERMGAKHAGETVVAVSHHFAISSLLCKLMGLGLSEFAGFGLKASSTSRIRVEDGRYSVELVNDVTHLSFT